MLAFKVVKIDPKTVTKFEAQDKKMTFHNEINCIFNYQDERCQEGREHNVKYAQGSFINVVTQFLYNFLFNPPNVILFSRYVHILSSQNPRTPPFTSSKNP